MIEGTRRIIRTGLAASVAQLLEDRSRRTIQIRRRLAATLVAVATAASPAWGQSGPSIRQLEAALAGLLPAEAGSARLPGAMLRVEAPALGLAWTDAVGTSDLSTGEPLRPGQTLRIASITKSFVAATILRLVEDERLSLDASLDDHLRPETGAVLRESGYDTRLITIRSLLQHTSGLFDFATSDEYLGRVAADPQHRWTRMEQLALAMEGGDPYGEPGETYEYSDTGYVLLGEVIETATRRAMAPAVRDLLGFDRLGIAATWFETLEPVPADAPPRAHQYLESLDANAFDPSLDLFGGGGLVSTLEDVARFYRALFDGEVLKDEATLALMLDVTPLSVEEDGKGYGMGIVRQEFDGVACYGHGGFWGVLAWHCPGIDLTVVAAATNVAARDDVTAMAEGGIAIAAAAIEEHEP